MQLSAQTHFSQGWNINLVDQIGQLGIDQIRDAVPWGKVETRKGKYDFDHKSAQWVNDALAAGLDVVLVFNPVNPLYDKGFSIHSNKGREAFADYVVATLKAFPGVTAIEIGNEYNGNDFVKGPIANAPKSKRDDYYHELIEAVDKALIEARIDVEVIGASTHSIPVDYFAALKDNGALELLDAISIHPYTTEPEEFAEQLAVLRQVVGDEIDIHVTEFGDNFASLAQAPGYLAKMVSVMAAANVASANWYAFAEQKFFPNMELFDRGTKSETPAGKTFALLEDMLATSAGVVTEIALDSHTYLYSFGDNAAILWGEPRGIELGKGVTAYDLSGRKIRDLSAIDPDTPIILRSDAKITADSIALGQSTLIAHSFHDFDLINDPGNASGFEGPWSYFAESGKGKVHELYTMGGGFGGGEPWTPYLGTNFLRPFQVNADTITPADFSKKNNPKSEFAVVERFTASEAGLVNIKGFWDVSDHTDDGIKLTVEVNDKAIFSTVVFDKKNGHEFTLELEGIALKAGDTIDFVVSSRGNAKGDVTTREIEIHDAGGPSSPPPGEPDPAPKPAPQPNSDSTHDYAASKAGITFKGGREDDLIIGGRGENNLFGKGGDDTLIGGASADRLSGQNGSDSLFGGAGNDILNGGAGDDLLDGGKGDDLLTGGSGNDIFVFSGAFGNDTIMDFAQGDKIDLSSFGTITDFGDLEITFSNKGALITIGESTILLRKVGEDALDGEDFLF